MLDKGINSYKINEVYGLLYGQVTFNSTICLCGVESFMNSLNMQQELAALNCIVEQIRRNGIQHSLSIVAYYCSSCRVEFPFGLRLASGALPGAC